MIRQKTPHCPYCGSIVISADAAVRRDNDSQEWEVTCVFDKGKTCDDCGEEFSECDWWTVETDNQE